MIQHVFPVDQAPLHNLEAPDCFCEPVMIKEFGQPIWMHQRVAWDMSLRYRWAKVASDNAWLYRLAYGTESA